MQISRGKPCDNTGDVVGLGRKSRVMNLQETFLFVTVFYCDQTAATRQLESVLLLIW